ncbi:MAG TPA: bifunctional diguanylate cyclase/phosphodiesterase [Candidatus Dormibacteraeota bacterium]
MERPPEASAAGRLDDLATELRLPSSDLERLPDRVLEAIRVRIAFDDLTGVLRRASGLIAAEREIKRSRRSGSTQVVAAFLDVDGLKATNDLYGHPAGDELLRQLASLLKARLRGQDLIFRYGGDEFVCLLVDADLEGARRLTRELNDEFKSRHRHGLSIGLAQLQPADTAATLLARADAALYAERKSRSVRPPHPATVIPAPQSPAQPAPSRAAIGPILRTAHEDLGLELHFISAGDAMSTAKPTVPVALADGTVCGDLYCRNRRRLARRDRQFLAALARLVGETVDELKLADAQRGEHVRTIIDAGLVGLALQPIVDLDTSQVIGLEALARFPSESGAGPDLLLAEADIAGLATELELMICETAVKRFRDLPAGAFLAVNASPALVQTPAFAAVLERVPVSRLVVEITEHSRIDDYERIRVALEPARRQGMRLAIDDVGAGFAGFGHMLGLEPDIIKLDIGLIRHIDAQAARRSLVASMVAFGRQTSADVVAEGIETAQELDALRELGVRYGQGYLLGRPSAVFALS